MTFPSPSSNTTNGTLTLSVRAGGSTYADKAFVSLGASHQGPSSTGPGYAEPSKPAVEISKTMLLVAIGLLFLGLALLLGFASTRVMPSEATPMQQQLSLYTVHGMRRSDKRTKQEGAGQLKDSAVAITEGFIAKRDFEESRATSSIAPGSASRRRSGS